MAEAAFKALNWQTFNIRDLHAAINHDVLVMLRFSLYAQPQDRSLILLMTMCLQTLLKQFQTLSSQRLLFHTSGANN